MDETIERYRGGHYKETGIGQSKLYPGIFDLLEFFAETGRPVAVATQKPQSIARLVLEHHGIADFFVSIRGGAADDESLKANTASGKVEIVAAALNDLHSQPAVMVGGQASRRRRRSGQWIGLHRSQLGDLHRTVNLSKPEQSRW